MGRALDLDLTATDNLQSALGLGATQIDVNAAADGGDAGEWLRRSSAAAPPGGGWSRSSSPGSRPAATPCG